MVNPKERILNWISNGSIMDHIIITYESLILPFSRGPRKTDPGPTFML